ncbi:M48 metallopeptidase family protein [[Mycoplasma] gypis]|uniref:M48 family metallopeptidase n=1 Tax=[Mycoplasma] gypis TaxID=92404 RepID=A0ABZ2RTW3_9BACT|nr:M48 family metallopeptidase [[Mycoplasma] gypis]MBN0919152.1 DUF45 domain-containing protein [[Mycoplasma] gypis]
MNLSSLKKFTLTIENYNIDIYVFENKQKSVRLKLIDGNWILFKPSKIKLDDVKNSAYEFIIKNKKRILIQDFQSKQLLSPPNEIKKYIFGNIISFYFVFDDCLFLWNQITNQKEFLTNSKNLKKLQKLDVNNGLYIERILNSKLNNDINIQKMTKNIEKYQKQVLLNYVIKRQEELKSLMGLDVEIKETKITKANGYFGKNIRSKQAIWYSLQLLSYSKEIIDYVIVHELAHFIEFNHSAKFYKIIAKVIPNYKEVLYYLKNGIFNKE